MRRTSSAFAPLSAAPTAAEPAVSGSPCHSPSPLLSFCPRLARPSSISSSSCSGVNSPSPKRCTSALSAWLSLSFLTSSITLFWYLMRSVSACFTGSMYIALMTGALRPNASSNTRSGVLRWRLSWLPCRMPSTMPIMRSMSGSAMRPLLSDSSTPSAPCAVQ